MASFSTFRSRLILLFALATFPAIALVTALSWHVYQNAKSASREAYRQIAAAVALQEQSIMRAAARTGRTIVAAIPSDLSPEQCSDRLTRVAAENPNLSALAFLDRSGVRCSAGRVEKLRAFDRTELLAALHETGTDEGGYSIVLSVAADETQIGLLLPAGLEAGRESVLVMVLDSAHLTETLNENRPADDGSVALIDSRGLRVVAGGGNDASGNWLPRNATVMQSLDGRHSAVAPSRDGRDFLYIVERVEGGELSAVAGFPLVRFGPAERQLAIGLTFPSLLFVIVLAVAWVAIDRLFLTWVRRLDATARRLAFGDFTVRAELPTDAPLELRQYASAFDQMTEVLGARTRELATVAQQRSHLLRELHHRVKNNFQVITSFLNLMKRDRGGETREALSFAESRVHAMAAAYKLALAQGDIRLVAVPVLVADVVSYVQHAADKPANTIRFVCEGQSALLELDRAIPLALVLVETLWPMLIDPKRDTGIVVRLEWRNDTQALLIQTPHQHGPVTVGRFQRAFLDQIAAKPLPDRPPDAVLAVVLPTEREPSDGSAETPELVTPAA